MDTGDISSWDFSGSNTQRRCSGKEFFNNIHTRLSSLVLLLTGGVALVLNSTQSIPYSDLAWILFPFCMSGFWFLVQLMLMCTPEEENLSTERVYFIFQVICTFTTCLCWFLFQPYADLQSSKVPSIFVRLTLYAVIPMSSATMLLILASVSYLRQSGHFASYPYVSIPQRELVDVTAPLSPESLKEPNISSDNVAEISVTEPLLRPISATAEDSAATPIHSTSLYCPSFNWLYRSSFFFYGLHMLMISIRLVLANQNLSILIVGAILLSITCVLFSLHLFIKTDYQEGRTALLNLASIFHMTYILYETCIFKSVTI